MDFDTDFLMVTLLADHQHTVYGATDDLIHNDADYVTETCLEKRKEDQKLDQDLNKKRTGQGRQCSGLGLTSDCFQFI